MISEFDSSRTMIETSGTLERIKKNVLTLEPKAKIVLFGSRARGDAREDSDWDLLILVPGEVDWRREQQFRHKLFDLELELSLAISTFVKPLTAWEYPKHWSPFLDSIKQEGVWL